jgi:tetraacyldisaccharide 4'-kinase
MQRLASIWLERGPLARALWPLSLLYGALWRGRLALYRARLLRTTRLTVPVLVIGNLIAGGAGKTPTVIATLALLRRAGWTPGVVSRGYGRREHGLRHVDAASDAREVGDEPLLIHLRTRAPVVVGRDRGAAGLALLRRHPEVDVVVCDDGLQHLALERDASVLVFDERGAGNGWLLPAGPLREPLPAVAPPASVVLYNARHASTALAGNFASRSLAGAVALDDWWRGLAASPALLQGLAGRPVVAVAGLAQPERFFAMLREARLLVTPLPLPDHHDFASLPWPPATADVLLTDKDAVKLRPARLREMAAGAATRVWVVALDFEPDAGYGAALLQLLDKQRADRVPASA